MLARGELGGQPLRLALARLKIVTVVDPKCLYLWIYLEECVSKPLKKILTRIRETAPVLTSDIGGKTVLVLAHSFLLP